jgi:hypothetical protein
MVCDICQKETSPRASYCTRCRKFIFHKPGHRARAEAMKLAWSGEQDGFLCHYTGVKLDESNPKSPWYLNFDHVIPGKKGKLVVCAALINGMKSDMSAEEFIAIVREFARYRRTGQFDKAVVELKYWVRLVRPSKLGAGRIPAPKGTTISDCDICGRKSVPGSIYCARCRKFVFGKYEHQARRKALKEAWSKDQAGFMCHYTGVKLEENDTRDPWYLSFDHRIPGKKGALDVSARFMNTVKATLTERQFLAVMDALDRHLDGAPFDKNII